MKISYNWLKEYIDLRKDPQDLSELLTNCGLEVEGLEHQFDVPNDFKGLVIGEVLTCENHPNADRLKVTTVNIGQEQPLNIVCGAPNVKEGQKVLVATVGTTLYPEGKPFAIKKAKIRGTLSEGMICAEDEVGIGQSHEGIMVLDNNTIPGTPASEYFRKDHVFEIGLTPNRTDAMGHIGVARDISAVLNTHSTKNRRTEVKLPTVDNFKIDDHELDIDVTIEDAEACPRYSGLSITGIKVEESPQWLKNRLISIGIRPINNIVDITNFVLMEIGQPLHAFDAEKISGKKVIIKKLKSGTKFTTLDEIDRKLTENDLMICNSKEGMCIAGVFGGIDSGVTEVTKNIFLESACFDAATIRKTAKHHGLQTDASFRFERGTDPEMTVYALKRAALLIKEIAGGKISSEVKDEYPRVIPKKSVKLYYDYVNKLIGKKIGNKKIINILDELDFEIIEQANDYILLEVPLYRKDVTRQADVVEEVLRIYGFNNVEMPTRMMSSIAPSKKPDRIKIQNMISDHLISRGYTEIMNNSLTDADYTGKIPDIKKENNVKVLNPLSSNLSIMRRTLLFGGLESIAHNINRKVNDLKLFEFGNTYFFYPEHTGQKEVTKTYAEHAHLSLFLSGRKQPENWNTATETVDVYGAKAEIEAILKKLNIDRGKIELCQFENEVFEHGLKYKVRDDALITLGALRHHLLNQFEIEQGVIFADFDWDAIIQRLPARNLIYQKVPKIPEVRRDLALLVDQSIEYQEIEKIAFRTEPKLLKRTGLFDVYAGKNIEQGKKSYAVSFILQHPEKTLTDKAIDKIMNKLMEAFREELNASIR